MQTLWKQKDKLDESLADKIRGICDDLDGFGFLGLYKPLIENWQLTFFVVTEGLAIWETGLEKIMGILPDNIERENRIYVELFAPKQDALKPQKYLEVELFIWDGLYLGLDNYYKSLKNVFEYEGACFMGGYGPANEPYNIAHFLGYDSMERISLVDDLMYGSVKRPDRMKIIIERLYKICIIE